jgi:hypothetical protein
VTAGLNSDLTSVGGFPFFRRFFRRPDKRAADLARKEPVVTRIGGRDQHDSAVDREAGIEIDNRCESFDRSPGHEVRLRGLLFDGDADRAFVVDEKAEALSGTILTALVAESILKRHPDSTVLYNVICGRIVPAGDIPDPQKLGLKLWVNDVIKQDSNTAQMIFTIAEQIAHLSSRITLNPGDVILTGTPSGVGAARKEFLEADDVVKLWIEHIGTLVNRMA